MQPDSGRVFLVGAGPGDPLLLTLRGAECLSMADIVLYDYLVSPAVLCHVPPSATLRCLGRHGHGRIMPQEEVNREMVREALAGKTVVRLKGGDPAVFGRLGEEIGALREAGVSYEVVPGVTAASAVAAYAEVLLTHREHASCVAFVTGHECSGKDGEPLDLAALADFPGTLVFYMGVSTAPEWAAQLVEHGKSGDTPVVVVRWTSCAAQTDIETTLSQLPQALTSAGIRPPAIIVVGDVVRSGRRSSWFASRPLFGKTVLVTRPAHQAHDLVDRLVHLGARVLLQPAIAITPPRDWGPVDDAIARLPSLQWLVFSSANGVSYFLDRLQELGLDLRALAGCRLAAIGPATAAELVRRGLRADLQPGEYRAEALATALGQQACGSRVLLLRASRGREVLAESLEAAGADVEQVVVYESNDIETAEPGILDELGAGRIDWVTVTSSAIARSLVAMLGGAFGSAKLAAISPLTAATLTDAGFTPAAVAEEYTTGGLIDAIVSTESTA